MFTLSFPQFYPSTPKRYLTHLYVPSLLYNTKLVFFCTKTYLLVASTFTGVGVQTFWRQSIGGSTDSTGRVVDEHRKFSKRRSMYIRSHGASLILLEGAN